MKLYKITFYALLVFGTLVSISSYSWITMWLGLEINLLAFIPLMSNNKNKYATEASLKYFLTQALASIVLLYSIVSLLTINEFISPWMNQTSMMFMNSALLTKLGAVPFHFWFPEVMEGLNWGNSLILMTWQKIAPMVLIMNNQNNSIIMNFSIITSVLVSGILGLNQTSLRKILAYSSINHIGWLLAAMTVSRSVWLIYLIIYFILTTNVIFMFEWTKTYNMTQLFNSINENKLSKLFMMASLLSLGGVPPFLGFFPKWIVMHSMMTQQLEFMSFIVIIGTLTYLYIYVRITLTVLVMAFKESKTKPKFKFNYPFIAVSLSLNLLIISVTLFLNSI